METYEKFIFEGRGSRTRRGGAAGIGRVLGGDDARLLAVVVLQLAIAV